MLARNYASVNIIHIAVFGSKRSRDRQGGRGVFLDFILASLHHIFVFSLVAIIAAELVLLRPGLDATTIARLGRLDIAYGITAAAIVVVGFARVFFGAKGADYYLHNHIFWTKIGLFAVIGLLSIQPTLRFLAWRRALAVDPQALPKVADVKLAKRFVHIEATLVLLLPILAAAMARGYGTH
jgi:putative membrane protein